MKRIGYFLSVCLVSMAGPALAHAGGDADGLTEQLKAITPADLSSWARIVVMVTVFGSVPTIVLLTTCYPRILILLGFLRRALGAQDLPPNMVIAGLALVLTGMVMWPVWSRVHEEAYVPYVNGTITDADVALQRAARPMKAFMLRHTYEKDLVLMLDLTDSARHTEAAGVSSSREELGGLRTPPAGSVESDAQTLEDVSFFVILPAFVLSELKTAFQMGFLLFLPFLLIDLVVSAILLSMGMFMLPPILISLPLKVLVFVLVDGWNLVVTQLLGGIA